MWCLLDKFKHFGGAWHCFLNPSPRINFDSCHLCYEGFWRTEFLHSVVTASQCFPNKDSRRPSGVCSVGWVLMVSRNEIQPFSPSCLLRASPSVVFQEKHAKKFRLTFLSCREIIKTWDIVKYSLTRQISIQLLVFS